MDDDLGKRIEKYISECSTGTLGTVNANGEPDASTVFIDNVGLDIYFNTSRESQKIKNIEKNPRVALAMQKVAFPKADKEVSGVQYSGTAKMISEYEMEKVPSGVMARHRAFNSVKAGNSVIVKVTPKKIYLIDYSKGFRYREALEI